MELAYVDEITLTNGRADRIVSPTQARHIHNIERRITSLLVECALVAFGVIAGTIGAVELLQKLDRWSPAWAAIIIVCGGITYLSFIPWMRDRLERRNKWIEINEYYWSINDLKQQFPSIDG